MSPSSGYSLSVGAFILPIGPHSGACTYLPSHCTQGVQAICILDVEGPICSLIILGVQTWMQPGPNVPSVGIPPYEKK